MLEKAFKVFNKLPDPAKIVLVAVAGYGLYATSDCFPCETSATRNQLSSIVPLDASDAKVEKTFEASIDAGQDANEVVHAEPLTDASTAEDANTVEEDQDF